MQSILVTGGAGFIGARLVRRLVETGHAVSVLALPKTDLSRIKDLVPKLQILEGDLTDHEGLEAIVKNANPSGVFHLAVSNMQSGVAAPDEEVIRNNLVGTVNLLAALQPIDYQFFINTGSFLEYGMRADRASQQESDRCEPAELYSITKLAATLYGQMLARREGKPIITLRIFSPYGPGMQRGRLLEALIARARNDEDIPMTEPKVTRDFIFVEDIVDLYLEAMERAKELKGEIYNAGTGVQTTLQELADLVLQTTGSKSKVQWNALPRVSYDRALWQADMTKTFTQFKWRPKHSVEEGVMKTIEFVRRERS